MCPNCLRNERALHFYCDCCGQPIDWSDEVEAIFANPMTQRYFPDFDTEYMLKKVPQGFPSDFVHADWLKRKAYTFSTPLTDEQVCASDFLDLVTDISRAAKPINDFLNYTFEEYGEFPDR